MRDRPPPVARAALRTPAATLDLVLFTPRGRQLAVLTRVAPRAGGAPSLPWVAIEGTAALDALAQQQAKQALGLAPSWLAQLGAFGDGIRHPSGAALSVGFVGVAPLGTAAPPGMEWSSLSEVSALGARQGRIVDAAVRALRDRMDLAPIAFRLLPTEFTLSELQEVYELLLGRRLHKASFRRALQGAYLVEPTDEWRSEGRGRPAQLFRYAPRKRRGLRRSVRFELLG